MKIYELQQRMGNSIPLTAEEQRLLYQRMLETGMEPGAFYQELEMDSRYVNAHRDVSFSNAAVQLHSHAFFELICCRNTCGVEYLVGSHRYRLQKGDIIFVAPGISHRPILPEELAEPYQRDVVWFSEEFALLLSRGLPAECHRNVSTHLLRTAGTEWEFLSDLFRAAVLESEEKRVGWELAVVGSVLQIVTHLNRALSDRSAAPLSAEAPSLLEQVVGYIERNLSHRITLGETARQCFASESTISHLFRCRMGVSFYRFVTQRRLIAAKERIAQGEAMEEVSRAVGFGDYSTFYRAFRQEYSIGPQQYKKLQGGG